MFGRFIRRSIILASILTHFVYAETMMLDDFSKDPESRWQYVSDQVMGGVSNGKVEFKDPYNEPYAVLNGQVSTENNGGFIQMRTRVDRGLVAEAKGVYIRARGNNQRYYIHLRTTGTRLPWQYYQASFDVTDDWQNFKLPLELFAPSSNWLRNKVKAQSIRSIGIVAFGRDHRADVEVAEIGFF